MHQLHDLILAQYDRMIGLDVVDVAVDACITKAPAVATVPAAVSSDRGKQGLKRSVLVDATGVPLAVVVAGANRQDRPLLEATLAGLEPWGLIPLRQWSIWIAGLIAA